MASPAVSTGGEFLALAPAHIDCQAQTIGSLEPVRWIEIVHRGKPAAAANPDMVATNPLGGAYRRNARRETGSQRGRDERG
jgi:hypothetical protein